MEFDRAQSLADFFKALGDETRLKILAYILENGEHCVLELCAALNLTQTNASRHLARLRAEGILRDRREAQCIFYSLDPNFTASRLCGVLEIIRELNMHKLLKESYLQIQEGCEK